MKSKRINRRDTLKIFTSLGLSTLATSVINHQLPFVPSLSRNQASNYIIILFDTLSARHMSLYGYRRKTTPNIEKFASSSYVYHRHYSASNFTQSSTASLLTGVYPWSHRSLEFFSPLLSPYNNSNIFSALSSEFFNIAYTHNIHAMNILEQFKSDIQLLKPIEDLLLFRANKLEYIFENDTVMGEYAAKRWLEEYLMPSYSLFLNPLLSTSYSIISSEINRKNKELYPIGVSEESSYLFKLEDAIDWITEITFYLPNPFLGYFHMWPPHESYKPRAEFYNFFANDHISSPEKPEHFFTQALTEKDLQKKSRLYDEYIAHVDWEFGRLIKNLEANGILDNTYIILTSDHGQMFERGIHGHDQPVLYESVIHTPLVIHKPGQTNGINIYSPVSAVDLFPTILHLTGRTPAQDLEGKVLPGLGGEEDNHRIIFSMHARRNAKFAPLNKVTLAAIQWPFKLIKYLGYEGLVDTDELYNLEDDPDELDNLAAEKPSIVSALSKELKNNQISAEIKSLKNRK